MTTDDANQLNTFLKGVIMGEDAFRDFIEKTKNEELQNICKQIKVTFNDYNKKITDILVKHHVEPEQGDGFGIQLAELIQKFRTATKITEESVKQTILETLEMAIDNSEKFLEKYEITNGENYDLIREIIDDTRAYYKQVEVIEIIK